MVVYGFVSWQAGEPGISHQAKKFHLRFEFVDLKFIHENQFFQLYSFSFKLGVITEFLMAFLTFTTKMTFSMT